MHELFDLYGSPEWTLFNIPGLKGRLGVLGCHSDTLNMFKVFSWVIKVSLKLTQEGKNQLQIQFWDVEEVWHFDVFGKTFQRQNFLWKFVIHCRCLDWNTFSFLCNDNKVNVHANFDSKRKITLVQNHCVPWHSIFIEVSSTWLETECIR